jgi:hypothetical protein
MRRIRISLRGLILLVTAVGLFLGYAEYRRKTIHQACEELKDYGYAFTLPSDWRDRIWQRKPIIGPAFYTANKDLLLLDLQNEAEDEKPIVSLATIGATRERLAAFADAEERALQQQQRIMRMKYEKWLREQSPQEIERLRESGVLREH